MHRHTQTCPDIRAFATDFEIDCRIVSPLGGLPRHTQAYPDVRGPTRVRTHLDTRACRLLRPISLLTLSLLTLLDSNFPVNPLWAWEFHPLNLRLCLSQTLRNTQCKGDWAYRLHVCDLCSLLSRTFGYVSCSSASRFLKPLQLV